jgi:hypothetical protein
MARFSGSGGGGASGSGLGFSEWMALAGLLKNELVDSPNATRQAGLAAETARWRPWTGMSPDYGFTGKGGGMGAFDSAFQGFTQGSAMDHLKEENDFKKDVRNNLTDFMSKNPEAKYRAYENAAASMLGGSAQPSQQQQPAPALTQVAQSFAKGPVNPPGPTAMLGQNSGSLQDFNYPAGGALPWGFAKPQDPFASLNKILYGDR